jgi:hypothetical protein
VKSSRDWRVVPNLRDYEQVRASFSWDEARRERDGLPGGQRLNISHEAMDRHVASPLKDHVAIRTMTDLLRSRAAAAMTKAKADHMIVVWLGGGPPHQEMFDLQPDAPAEYRGEFKPIRTNVPGIEVPDTLENRPLRLIVDEPPLIREAI